MSLNKPLFLDLTVGKVKQNPSSQDLDIPVTDRVALLEEQMRLLTTFLATQGIELPEELLSESDS